MTFRRHESENLEDLWDFGTVRHGGRPNTIGRAQHSIRATGPPLTWENNETAPRYDGRPVSQLRISDPARSSPVTERNDRSLPPIPPSSANSSGFQQSTVRHMQPVENRGTHGGVPVQDGASEDYEDYDDQYPDTYSSTKSSMVQQKLQELQLEDEVPDTTMLDSVVLPAIASVSFIYAHVKVGADFCLHCSAISKSDNARGEGGSQCFATSIHRRRKNYTWSDAGACE